MPFNPRFLSAVSKQIHSYVYRSSHRSISYLHIHMAASSAIPVSLITDHDVVNNENAVKKSKRKFKPRTYVPMLPSQRFKTKEELLVHFDTLMSTGDIIGHKDAYILVKACGKHHMVSESTSTKNELLKYIWSGFQRNGVTLQTHLWNTLLSTYIENNDPFEPVVFLSNMWNESSAEPNHTTFTLLIQAYALRGDTMGAMKIVEFMLKNDEKLTEVVYGWLIRAFAKNGDMEGIDEIFQSMKRNNIRPRHAIYEQLINSHAENGDFDGIEKTIKEMTAKEIYPTSSTYINLLEQLLNAGHANLIEKIWDKIDDYRLLRPYISPIIIQCLSSNDYESAVILLKISNQKKGSEYGYSIYMQQKLFSLLKYTDKKDIVDFGKASTCLEQHFKFKYGTLLKYFFDEFGLDRTLELIRYLVSEGKSVSANDIRPLFEAYSKEVNIEGIVKIYECMVENDIPMRSINIIKPVLFKDNDSENCSVGQLLYALISDKHELKTKKVVAATVDSEKYILFQSLDKIKNSLNSGFNGSDVAAVVSLLHMRGIPVASLIDHIMKQLGSGEQTEEALVFLRSLVEGGLPIRSHSYTNLLKMLVQKGMSDELFSFVFFMKENNIEPDSHQLYQMLQMASKIGDSMAAQYCFDKLKGTEFKSDNIYGALIHAYNNEIKRKKKNTSVPFDLEKSEITIAHRIIQLFNEMVEADIKPLNNSVTVVVQNYLLLHDIENAEKVAEKFDLKDDKFMKTYMIRAYAAREDYNKAREYFNEAKIQNPNSVLLYNEMLYVYLLTGDVENAEELYKEMLEVGIKNIFTQVCRIKIFLKVGKPEECLNIIENVIKSEGKISMSLCLRVLRNFAVIGDANGLKKLTTLLNKHYKDEVPNKHMTMSFILFHIKVGEFEEASSLIRQAKDSEESSSLLDLSFYRGKARNAAGKSDIKFVKNIITFLKMNNLNTDEIDEECLKALNRIGDFDGLQTFYSDRNASGDKFNGKLMDILKEIIADRGLHHFQI